MMQFFASLLAPTESQPAQVYNAVKANDIVKLQVLSQRSVACTTL